MDPVVFIPETRNTSSTDNVTFTEESGCTSLNGLDLADTFTGMDIGNTEFWGTMSDFWRPCFIIYCWLFYAALLILFGSYVGLLCYTLKKAAYSLRTLVYLLTLYIIWSTFSLAHGFLMINSLASSSSSDRGLAHATIVLDTITSASFVCIILVAFYSSLDSKIHLTLRYALLSTSIIYIEAIIIVVLSIPVGISVTLIFVCLIVLKSLMFVTSMVLLFIVIFFKHNSLSAKELICLLWKDNKILLIIAFPYFLLLYTYFLYISITVISNNDCTENIQLQREGWLVFNSLLRICEVSLSTSYFIKARMFVRETCITDSISESDLKTQEPKRSVADIFHIFSESQRRPVGRVRESANSSDLEDEEQKALSYTKNLLCATEIKYPPHTTNLDVEILRSHSTVTDQLQSVDSDRFLDTANFSSTDTLNVEVINAHAPVDTEYLIGDIEVGMFDERGGVFHSYKHGVTVIFPAGAIPSGILAELKFAATLISPIPFQSNTVPLSAIFWLCMDSKVRLQKPIQLRLPLLKLENKARSLQFAKSSHSTKLNIIGDQMKGLENGTFAAGGCYGSIEVDHFCYYCIMDNLDQKDIPFNKYSLILMKQSQPNDNSWSVHICLVPDLRTCEEYLKGQYECYWEYKELTKFSFVDGCDELEIELSSNDFGNAATIDLFGMKIKQEDADFHQYYSNGKLEELKYRMDQKQYPPRCKTIVTAKHKNFFVKSSWKIIIQCTCNAKFYYKGKISIPCTSNEGDFSESDLELPAKPRAQRFKSSTTSGYMSDDDVDDFDTKEHAPGNLKLRKVITLTSDVEKNWYKLGMALQIPISIMEKFYGKYNANPMKGLNRVYCYWLSDKNGLSPTWEKLCSALREIKKFSIAADVEKLIKQTADVADTDDSTFNNDPNDQALKDSLRIMRDMPLELLDIDTLIPLLNKYHLLTQSNMYDLRNRLVPPTERASALVHHILPSKGSGAFTLFVKCLQEEKEHLGHQELLKLFNLPLQCENADHQNLPTLPQQPITASTETEV